MPGVACQFSNLAMYKIVITCIKHYQKLGGDSLIARKRERSKEASHDPVKSLRFDVAGQLQSCDTIAFHVRRGEIYVDGSSSRSVSG